MAITRNDMAVVMPTAPQMFSPNFEALATGLNMHQQRFDQFNTLIDSMAIDALDVDRPRANQVIKGLEDKAQAVADSFMQSTTQGMRDLAMVTRDVKRTFRPGGEAWAMEQNKKMVGAYNQMVDKMFEDGDIVNSQKVNWLKAQSLGSFAGTNFNSTTGGFTSFSGLSPSKDIDIVDYVLEQVKGIKESEVKKGTFKVMGDQYFEANTMELVTADRVQALAIQALQNNPQLNSFLTQEAQMSGITNESGINDYVKSRKLEAVNAAVMKEHYTKIKPKYHKNWMLAMNHGQGHALDRIAYEKKLENTRSVVSAYSNGRNIPSMYGNSLAEVSEVQEANQQKSVNTVHKLNKLFGKTDAYTSIGLDEFSSPLEVYTAYKNKRLKLDEVIGSDGHSYSRSFIESQFINPMAAAIERASIAEQKLAAAEQYAESKTGYVQSELDAEIDQALSNTLKPVTTEKGTVLSASALAQAIKLGNNKGYRIKFAPSSSISGIGSLQSDAIIEILDAKGNVKHTIFRSGKFPEKSEGFAEFQSAASSVTALMNDGYQKFNRAKDEYLSTRPDVATRFTTELPKAVGEDLESAQASLKSMLQDRVNIPKIIEESGLPNETKIALTERFSEGDPFVVSNDVMISEDAPSGEKVYKITYQVGDKDTGNVETHEVYIPVGNYETQGIREARRSGAWDADRQIGIAKYDFPGQEYEIPLSPGYTINTKPGETGISVNGRKLGLQDFKLRMQANSELETLSEETALDVETLATIFSTIPIDEIVETNSPTDNAELAMYLEGWIRQTFPLYKEAEFDVSPLVGDYKRNDKTIKAPRKADPFGTN